MILTQTMTTGNPCLKILRFTLPIFAGGLFQQFYNMADAFIISRILGVKAFAGVSSTGGISFLLLGFAQGMSAGLSIAVAQSYGAKDYQNVKRQFVHNLIIGAATAVLLTGISVAGTGPLLTLLRTPADIYEYAGGYLQVLFLGIVGSMLFNLFADTLRALGDSRSPLHYLLIASALNILLDYLLIYYTPLGVRGAALATIVSQGVSASLCWLRIQRKVDVLSLKGYRDGFEPAVVLENLKLGIPMAFQSSVIALGVIVMQFATNGMGTAAVAAYAAAAKIDGIAVEPLRALGITMTTYTAQNKGAKRYDRILTGVRQCTAVSLGLSAALCLLMLLGGRMLTMLFIGAVDPQIIDLSYEFLAIHGILYFILALLFIYRYTLQGMGYAFIPTLAGAMELLMRAVSAFFLVPRFEFTGASFATPLSWFGALIPVAAAYFLVVKKGID